MDPVSWTGTEVELVRALPLLPMMLKLVPVNAPHYLDWFSRTGSAPWNNSARIR